MKDTLEQQKIYLELLEQKKEDVENNSFDKIHKTYKRFYSSYNSLFKLLCDEGIIKEDPYKEDYSLHSLKLPDESHISHNEEEYQLAIRLSHYQALLEYIKEKIDFSFEELTPKSVDLIMKLVQFIDWYRLFDHQPQGENTVALNKILFLYQKDIGHTFVVSTLKSTTGNIDRYSKILIDELEEVKLVIDEEYKILIRENIFSTIKLPPQLNGENIPKAHNLVIKKIKESKLPLHKTLIEDILLEDYSPEGDILKKDILDRLTITPKETENNEVTEKKIDPKEFLERAILELYKISSQVFPILTKTQENSITYREETYSLLEKLIDYIKHSIFLNKRETFYTLKVIGKSESDSELKEINLEKFLTSFNSLHTKLDNYKNRDLPLFKALLERPENEIEAFTHQLLSKCRYSYKIAYALDTFFKRALEDTKGIQVELQAILSILNKAQALYQEYTNLKEESQNKLVERRVQT